MDMYYIDICVFFMGQILTSPVSENKFFTNTRKAMKTAITDGVGLVKLYSCKKKENLFSFFFNIEL